MKIFFKNGEELIVTDEIVTLLYEQILEGSKMFASFRNGQTQKIDYVINVTEISHIVRL